MSGRGFDAVIFDFDGVIADTEPLHHRAFCQVVAEAGLACDWDTYCAEYIGFDDRDLFRAAYQRAGLPLDDTALRRCIAEKAAAFIALTQTGVPTYAGIPEVIQAMSKRWPLAICSGALRSDIDPILDQLNVQAAFTVRVTAEDVAASKPDPACYRLAVERVGEAMAEAPIPRRCLAIEDTPAGIAAAAGAGLTVWGITHTHPAAALSQADRVFDDLPALYSAAIA